MMDSPLWRAAIIGRSSGSVLLGRAGGDEYGLGMPAAAAAGHADSLTADAYL